MKKISFKHILIGLSAFALMQASCKKDLELLPLDEFNDAIYWKSPADFEKYANQFYTYERTFADVMSSGFIHSDQASDFYALSNGYANGENSIPSTDGTYSTAYTRIRRINYLLQSAAEYAKPVEIAAYVAEARFFRAYLYFDLLQTYGEVPLITKRLELNSPELAAPKTTRDSLVNFIVKDLSEAIPDLPLNSALSSNQIGRITKGAAQSFLARVALFEGTWQKFRNNAGRGNEMLDIAITNSDAVISSNQYSLFAPAALGDSAQKYMFILEDEKSNPAGIKKSDNKEYILANRYGQAVRQIRWNISHAMQANIFPVARKLATLYLCDDGLPIERSPRFQGYSTMVAEYLNRDNRMRYTLMRPGDNFWKGNANFRVDWIGGTADMANAFIKGFDPTKPSNSSGYSNQKWAAERQVTDNEEGYDFPVIRYAEVLLTYAEAVFERNGAITDAQLDRSLNLVRNRVNKTMPKLSNAFAAAHSLDMRTEIRRERSIELFLEGFRLDDLKRWNTAVIELAANPTGIKWTGTEYTSKWTAHNGTAKDANGCIITFTGARRFSEKNYVLPFAVQELQLNPALKQPSAWQ